MRIIKNIKGHMVVNMVRTKAEKIQYQRFRLDLALF